MHVISCCNFSAMNVPSLKSVNGLGDSELIIAGRKGDIESLRKIHRDLIGRCGSQNDVCNIFAHHSNRIGKTVLHEAAQNSREECVGFLVGDETVGMDPDCLKQGDWTPLMLACTKTNLNIIRILVGAGASVSLRNKDGWTPFHIACREGDGTVVAFFLSVCPLEVLHTRSKNGRTPLHTAALYGRLEIVDMLIRTAGYGDPDEGDNCGSTPLMDALRGGHVQVGKRLIEAGADPWKCDAVGRQAIHLVAQAGREDSLDLLVHLHAERRRQQPCDSDDSNATGCEIVNIVTNDQSCSSPAHFAAKEGHVILLKRLKACGAIMSARDAKGRTPLHMAAMGQRYDCVVFLLSLGLNNVPDDQGVTPSELASNSEVKRCFHQDEASAVSP